MSSKAPFSIRASKLDRNIINGSLLLKILDIIPL